MIQQSHLWTFIQKNKNQDLERQLYFHVYYINHNSQDVEKP